jgi:outer membrane biosynthesis protein TonB
VRPPLLPLRSALLLVPLLACASPKPGAPEEARPAAEPAAAEPVADAERAPAAEREQKTKSADASAPSPKPARPTPAGGEAALDDAAAGPSTHLDIAVPAINGGLNRDIIRRIASDHAADVRSCHARALAATPDLAGELLVEIELDDDGRVVEAQLADTSAFTQRDVANCVLALVAGWSFPDAGGEGRATLAFDLAPE